MLGLGRTAVRWHMFWRSYHTTKSWKGGEQATVHINDIGLSPDIPKPGANLTVTVVGTTNEIIEVLSNYLCGTHND